MSEIEKKVRDIIVDKLCISEDEIKPESSFQNDLGADSLDGNDTIYYDFKKVNGQWKVHLPPITD